MDSVNEMPTPRQCLLTSLRDRVLQQRHPGRPFVVGVSGMDAAGKSSFAAELKAVLEPAVAVTVIHLDHFHHPRAVRHAGEDEVENFLRRTINFAFIEENLLAPLQRQGQLSFQAPVLNLATDTYSDWVDYEVGAEGIVVVEGIFLYRKSWQSYFDLTLFLRVTPEVAIERGVQRDYRWLGEDVRRRYEQRYIPAQLRYFQEENPEALADIVINNNEFENPVLLQG